MAMIDYTYNIEYDGVKYAVDKEMYIDFRNYVSNVKFYGHESYDGVGGYTLVILELSEDIERKLYGFLKEEKEKLQQPTADAVEHPTHYTSHPSGIECIEVTRHYCFAIGNAIKYLWRAGLKQDADKSSKEKEIEDLRKAVWYINDRIKQLESE